MDYCENCGGKLNEKAKFCSKCGTKIIIEQNITSKKICDCGFKLGEEYQFCPMCGKQIAIDGTSDLIGSVKKTEYKCILTSYDFKKKINVIKKVRELTGIGLVEAKNIVENTPSLLGVFSTYDEALNILAHLRVMGVIVEIK